MDDVDGVRPRGRMPPTEANEVLVEPKQLGARACTLARQVLAVTQEIAEAVGLLRADLLAHEEHRRARRQQRQAERDAAAGLSKLPCGSEQRRAGDGGDDRARRAARVARLVVGFVVYDLVELARHERAGELLHVQRSVAS